MMIILWKALLGAGILVGIHYLTRTQNYYLAHLALSCPLLSLVAHYFISNERGSEGLKHTVLFGIYALIPFLVYLGIVYLLSNRLKIVSTLIVASVAWLFSATILAIVWKRVFPH